jgi:predicted oxidoreductase
MLFAAADDKAVRLRAPLEQIRDELGAETIDEVLYAWLLVHPARMMPIVGSGKKDRTYSCGARARAAASPRAVV